MIRRDEPDSVHDMRVAIRRLRSTLKSAGKDMGMPAAGRLRAELKWLGGVLGEARDNEVLASYLRARLAEVPAEQVMGPVQARQPAADVWPAAVRRARRRVRRRARRAARSPAGRPRRPPCTRPGRRRSTPG